MEIITAPLSTISSSKHENDGEKKMRYNDCGRRGNLSFYHCGSTHIPLPSLRVETRNLATVVCYNRYCDREWRGTRTLPSLSGQTVPPAISLVARRRVTLRLPHLTLNFFSSCSVSFQLTYSYPYCASCQYRALLLLSLIDAATFSPPLLTTSSLRQMAIEHGILGTCTRFSRTLMRPGIIAWYAPSLSWIVIFTHPWKRKRW